MRTRRGVQAIEFAFIAPILFGLLFSSLEGAWIVIHQMSLENSVNAGAHTGAVTTRTEDSLAIARATADANWASNGLSGDPTFSASYEGSLLLVEGELEHASLTGMWGPYLTLSSRTRLFLEP